MSHIGWRGERNSASIDCGDRAGEAHVQTLISGTLFIPTRPANAGGGGSSPVHHSGHVVPLRRIRNGCADQPRDFR
ncbi:hypothetical protein MLD38_035802 [Melastoma candidum]|uniref:Uncharacterized protein n=1 Tax=Melastoma candidum TaxID=119954 RepID=A0ACB9LH90_9MYRT|nr:hypothetical protein MLD38_035802 [Melastoma candidum]